MHALTICSTFPLSCRPSGDVPAHSIVSAPSGAGCWIRRKKKVVTGSVCRASSVRILPGFKEQDTIPWSAYLRANSLATKMLPCSTP
jgi:hypothetical protein